MFNHASSRLASLLLVGCIALCPMAVLAITIGVDAPSAYAQAIQPPGSTTVDVSPAVDTLLDLLNSLVVPLLAGLAALFWRKVGLDKIVATAKMNEMLHAGLQRGVDALEAGIRNTLHRDGKPVTIDVHNQAVATVADRMVELSPDLLNRLGVGENRLRELALEKIRTWQDKSAWSVIEPAQQISGTSPTGSA